MPYDACYVTMYAIASSVAFYVTMLMVKLSLSVALYVTLLMVKLPMLSFT